MRSGVAFVLAAAGAAVGGGGGKRRHCKRKGRDCGFAKGGLNRPGMEYLVGDGLWGVGCWVLRECRSSGGVAFFKNFEQGLRVSPKGNFS